jgi:acyl-CoA thioesterase FadM
MERAAKPANALRLMVGMIDRVCATNAATGVCVGQGGRDMCSMPQAMMRALAP